NASDGLFDVTLRSPHTARPWHESASEVQVCPETGSIGPLKVSTKNSAPGPCPARSSVRAGWTVSTCSEPPGPLTVRLKKPCATTGCPASIFALLAPKISAYSYAVPGWLNMLAEK